MKRARWGKRELINKLTAIRPFLLLGISVVCSIFITEIIVVPMDLFFHGDVTRDFLITGIVCAFIVSLIICYLFVNLIAQIRESEKQFRSLFETMAEAVALHELIFDNNGIAIDYRIVAVNPAFEMHTGLSATQAIGALASALYSSAPPYLEEYATVVRTQQTHHFETYYPPLDKYFRIEAFSHSTGRFVTVFENITERIKASEELKRLKELLERQATRDPLTGISNRTKFNEVLGIEISRSKRFSLPLSLIMIDLDYFKTINDTYGHNAGDIVLRDFASKVSTYNRTNDLFTRWGGEEFMILATNVSKSGAVIFAEKLRLKIEAFDFSPVGRITCSFGVAEFDKNDTFDSFINKADTALYRAKSAGRNRVESSS
jgi:diguanylate cyclase (GGDEF)-like protein/PAS domain S-box-containing protein